MSPSVLRSLCFLLFNSFRFLGLSQVSAETIRWRKSFQKTPILTVPKVSA